MTADSVGRGWPVPARLIPAEMKTAINDLAEQLGYVQVDETWGVGHPPADLRVPVDTGTSLDAPVPGGPFPDGSISAVLAERVRAGLLSLGEEFTRSWNSCSAESVLLFATAPEPGESFGW